MWRGGDFLRSKLRMRFLLAHHFARVFVVTHTKQPWVPKLVVIRPLNEAYLDDDLRIDPMGAQAGEADGFGEWGPVDLYAI